MYLDWKRGAAVSLVLLALIGCGAPDRGVVGPPISSAPSTATMSLPIFTPVALFPTITPETPYQPVLEATPARIATPAETPIGTPTPLPGPTVALPPTPVLPLGSAIEQLAGDTLLYIDRNGFLMLTDGQQSVWVTSDDTLCDRESQDRGQVGAWSTDERYLAFSCRHAGASTIVIWDTRTGALKGLDAGASTTNLELFWPHAWSPTAAQFLVVARTDGGQEIALADAATGRIEVRDLIQLGTQWSAAAWSPNGSRIALLLVRDHGGQPAPGIDPGLYLVDSDGSNRRYLANVFVDGSVFRSIDWSRDGRLIIVDHSIEDGLWADLIISDSGRPTEVRDTLQVPSVFHWAPDGRRYLVREWLSAATDGSITQVETGLGERTSSWSLRGADGALLQRFVSTPGRVVTNVAWMPDSQRFMMLAERSDVGLELIAADISGGQSTVATYSYPFVTTNQLAVSPSGDLLAIDLGQSHIVIMDMRGQMRAEFDGRLLGWRPRR